MDETDLVSAKICNSDGDDSLHPPLQAIRVEQEQNLGCARRATETVDFGSIYAPDTEKPWISRDYAKSSRSCAVALPTRPVIHNDPLNIAVVGRGIDALFAFI